MPWWVYVLIALAWLAIALLGGHVLGGAGDTTPEARVNQPRKRRPRRKLPRSPMNDHPRARDRLVP